MDCYFSFTLKYWFTFENFTILKNVRHFIVMVLMKVGETVCGITFWFLMHYEILINYVKSVVLNGDTEDDGLFFSCLVRDWESARG